MGFLHCLVLLAVEVAEIQRPQNDLVFGDLVKQAVERVAKLLSDAEAEKKPVVLG